MRSEIWKPYRDWPYAVSSLGRVRRSRAGRTSPKGKILKPGVKRRYLGITLCDGGRRTTGYIARMVCEAFHGPKPSPRHHAAHDNGIETDNRAANLSWKLPAENEADKKRHGRAVFGSKHKLAKLTEPQVIEIKRLLAARLLTQKEIARMFGVSVGKIGHIKLGISWKHVAV